MILTERHWWAILVDAEALAESGENILAAHELAGLARVKLRDEFGINLDTVWTEARPEFLRLLEKARVILVKK